MPLKIRIQQTNKGFTGYLSNKVYKAPTRQGVIDLAMAEWLTIEDLPKVDIEPLMKRIRHIIEQCPTSSLDDLFCYDHERWDFNDWDNNDAFLTFIEENHAVEPHQDAMEDKPEHENLIDALENLGFSVHTSFEVDAYVPEKKDAYWILKVDDLYYYISSIYHAGYEEPSYYSRNMTSARTQLNAVSHAPVYGEYNNPEIAVRANLAAQIIGRQKQGEVRANFAAQIIGRQKQGEVNPNLTGDEK